ncbi:DUF3817 domain-containing protein [Plantactinospora sp. ZYX-F-223]|uniref:DUF3817 domain-containing protein n=1 Tax=Plantactinospora sp. ZYX-F-223 TaxID=3144103 RepID=UPI0031FBCBFF
MTELRWLHTAAGGEAMTLLALLVNLSTVRADWLSSTVGPLHGFAWLATIALAWSAPLPRTARLLALVPGVGGMLVLRHARRTH